MSRLPDCGTEGDGRRFTVRSEAKGTGISVHSVPCSGDDDPCLEVVPFGQLSYADRHRIRIAHSGSIEGYGRGLDSNVPEAAVRAVPGAERRPARALRGSRLLCDQRVVFVEAEGGFLSDHAVGVIRRQIALYAAAYLTPKCAGGIYPEIIPLSGLGVGSLFIPPDTEAQEEVPELPGFDLQSELPQGSHLGQQVDRTVHDPECKRRPALILDDVEGAAGGADEVPLCTGRPIALEQQFGLRRRDARETERQDQDRNRPMIGVLQWVLHCEKGLDGLSPR